MNLWISRSKAKNAERKPPLSVASALIRESAPIVPAARRKCRREKERLSVFWITAKSNASVRRSAGFQTAVSAISDRQSRSRFPGCGGGDAYAGWEQRFQ